MNALLSRKSLRAANRAADYRAWEDRALNGARLVGVHAAFLAGHDSLPAMMDDLVFNAFVARAVFDEILPSIPTPEAAKRARAKAELETLRDAAEGGELLPLTVNSVSQWRVGLLPSLLDYRRSRGTVAPALALSLAALISFHRARPAADDGFEGVRAGRRYPIRDEATVLIADAWASFDVNEDWYAFAYGVLGEADLWGEELNRIPALVGTIAQDLAMIATSGARAAVASLNSQQR